MDLSIVVVVKSLSQLRLFATPWTAAWQASLSFTISWSLLKLMSIESVMPSNHLVLSHPLILLTSVFPSITAFPESVLCIGWPKYWSSSFSISPFNEFSGLISFRIDWLDLLAVQGTNKRLQHRSSKAPILRSSGFFMVQLSHPYVTTGKTIALTMWTFVSKGMFLLFNTLAIWDHHSFSSKEQESFSFMAAVTVQSDFGAQGNNVSVSIVSPSICHEVMGQGDHSFLNIKF